MNIFELTSIRRRSSLIALAVVFAIASPLALQTFSADASPTATAAKKCKKGYKKVKGKCKKNPPKISKVELNLAGYDGTYLKASGAAYTAKPINNVRVDVTVEFKSAAGTIKRTKRTNGNSFSIGPFVVEVPYSGPFPVAVTAKSGGKSSQTITIEN